MRIQNLLRFSLLFLLFLMAFLSCQKEEIERRFARIRTLPATEIDSTGVTLHAEVLDFNEEVVIDYGFIWTTYDQTVFNLPPERFSYKSLGAKLDTKEFSARIEAGLEADIVYYVRAYVRSAKHTVYGEAVAFTSQGGLAPIIEKVTPAQVMPGDTITIQGKHFINIKERGRVTIGEQVATIVAADSATVQCVVPLLVNDNAPIIIQSIDGASTAAYPLPKVISPQITSISPSTATIGDTVTLEGIFSSVDYWNQIEGIGFTLVSSSRNRIKIIVEALPLSGSFAYVSVKVGYRQSELAYFTITKPVIEDFYPKQGHTGDTITIVGKYFIPNAPNNFVNFGGFSSFNIVQSTKGELKVVVSSINTGTQTSISDRLVVIMAGYSIETSQSFKYIIQDWNIEAGLPGTLYQSGTLGFTLQNKLYYNDSYASDWWIYNEQSKAWSVGTSMPRLAGSDPTNDLAVTIDGNAYVLQKDNENQDSLLLWRYTQASNQWLKLQSLKVPADFNYYANSSVAFNIGRKLFVCLTSKENPCWVFDIDTQKWQSFSHYLNVIPTNAYEKPTPITAVAYGQKAYFVVKQLTLQYLLEYNAASDTWKLLYEFPFDAYLQRKATFVLNNKILFLGLAQVFELNVNTQQIQRKEIDFLPSDGNLNEAQAFLISNRVFFAIGNYLYEWFPR